MTDRAHSVHGASSAYRWFACPGSVKLIGTLGAKDSGASRWAEEGTAAHELAEVALGTRAGDPHEWVGARASNGVLFDPDMADAVAVYVDEVNGLRARCAWSTIEGRFSLGHLARSFGVDGVDLFGTCDFAGYDNVSKTLYVRDYKHGRGIEVSVEDNPQVQYYGLGALGTLVDEIGAVDVQWVDLGIVQPRAGHPAVRTWRIPAEKLRDFARRLIAAVEATLDPDAPLRAGEHCRFCPALGAGCPAAKMHAQEKSRTMFDDLPEEAAVKERAAGFSDAELAQLCDAASYLKLWAEAVQAETSRRLDQGVTIAGWKLVDKRAVRRWVEDARSHVANELEKVLEPEEIYQPAALKSVAQIEKVLKRNNIRLDEILDADGAVEQHSSGTTLARANDPRTARPGSRDPRAQFPDDQE